MLLERLLRPVRSVALAEIASGAFSTFLVRGTRGVTLEDAARITAEQMAELARFVVQCNPKVLRQLLSMLAQGPVPLACLSDLSLRRRATYVLAVIALRHPLMEAADQRLRVCSPSRAANSVTEAQAVVSAERASNNRTGPTRVVRRRAHLVLHGRHSSL
jgi:hypothetical protein